MYNHQEMTHAHPMLGIFAIEIPEEKEEKIEKNLELELFI